jgi:deoxycytidylate deaminase
MVLESLANGGWNDTDAAPMSDQTELVVGLVGAVGTDLERVANELRTEVKEYAYTATVLRMSEYLKDLPWAEDFAGMPEDERIWLAMDAGTKLRTETAHGDALALWAISDIVSERTERASGSVEDESEELPANLDRHAWILRSLKTRDEVATLRAVYGPRFVLFAAYSPDEQREQDLSELIRLSRADADSRNWSHTPASLIARDRDENRARGQDVEGTFHQADFFVDASDPNRLRSDVERSLEILFGHPFRTPTRDEYAQFQASGAALRSAEASRQVGAAIVTYDGSVVSLGTNEVPKAGGGSVWEDSAPDNREFAVSEIDTNRREQDRIAGDLADKVRADLREAASALDPDAREALVEGFGDGLEQRLLDTKLRDLTEYGRAVHAEMAALLDAARRGLSVQDCTLHTTTFPCHNCARHIIGAGLLRVVFVEPYSKSRALDLHAQDLLVGERNVDDTSVVSFEPFRGVAPRRYLEMFSIAAKERAGQRRKDDDGRIQREFDKRAARPLFSDLEPEPFRPALPAYRRRELLALGSFEEFSEKLTAGRGDSDRLKR